MGMMTRRRWRDEKPKAASEEPREEAQEEAKLSKGSKKKISKKELRELANGTER